MTLESHIFLLFKKDIKMKKVGKGLKFQRLRRVTGYIVGDYKAFFNDAKQSEVEQRVKHC